MGLDKAFHEKFASTPYHVMFGRAPLTSFSTLASSTGEDWKVDAIDEEILWRKVANVVEVQQRLHKVVEEGVEKTATGKGRLTAEGSYRTLRWEIM